VSCSTLTWPVGIMIVPSFGTVDGSKIFYREAGPKTAPTILLLHASRARRIWLAAAADHLVHQRQS
jgi:hypothetical protein